MRGWDVRAVSYGAAVDLISRAKRLELPWNDLTLRAARMCGYDPDATPGHRIGVYWITVPDLVRLHLEIDPLDSIALTSDHYLVIHWSLRDAHVVGPADYRPLGWSLIQCYLRETAPAISPHYCVVGIDPERLGGLDLSLPPEPWTGETRQILRSVGLPADDWLYPPDGVEVYSLFPDEVEQLVNVLERGETYLVVSRDRYWITGTGKYESKSR